MKIEEAQDSVIMVVDDDPVEMLMLSESFKDLGFTVLEAESGELALELVEKRIPDVILLDIMMPGIDGFETCRRLKDMDGMKEIPVIFMSSLTETFDKIRGFSAGAVDYIPKPFNQEEVLARISTHLRIQRLQKSLRDSNEQLQQENLERNMAAEELRRLRNFLRDIVNSMPSILVGVDPNGRVIQWNREAERTTGYTEREALGRKIRDVFPMLAKEMDNVLLTILDCRPLRKERVPLESDGDTRFSDVTIYPLITDGSDGAVIRVDDVTDRVRIEERMVQSEKMLSVGGLAAGMAHELNNPLAGILQNAQVMRNRLNEGLYPNRRAAKECGASMKAIKAYFERRGFNQMMDSIMESGMRAAEIVDNMLNFSGMSGFEFAEHDLCLLLDKTVELTASDLDLKKKCNFRKIEITREYHDVLPKVPCEGVKIRQVFFNILKNGAEAMAEHRLSRNAGKAPRFTLRIIPEDDMVRIEIEDNGPGMSEPIRRRIFEPFFTTKDIGAGVGLGLSVSYFIITETHGGSLAAESKIDGGSKFIIRLPLKRKDMSGVNAVS